MRSFHHRCQSVYGVIRHSLPATRGRRTCGRCCRAVGVQVVEISETITFERGCTFNWLTTKCLSTQGQPDVFQPAPPHHVVIRRRAVCARGVCRVLRLGIEQRHLVNFTICKVNVRMKLPNGVDRYPSLKYGRLLHTAHAERRVVGRCKLDP